MVDLLVVWGVTQAVGFVFKPILEDLAKDSAKDWAKDLFKDSLKNVIKLPSKEPLEIAAGKALKEFLQLVQDELEEAEVSEEQLKNYIKPLKQFIKDKSIKEILGSAFKDDCQTLDTKTLAKIWHQLDLSSLPNEFNWEKIGKKYLKKAKAVVRESDDLRAIIDSQNLETLQENTKELTGIVPEFDLIIYQKGLKKEYGNLKLDSLDTSVYDYRERLKVWQVFIAQNARESQEYLPQVYELPKEHQKRLSDSNQLETEIDLEKWQRYKQVYYQQPICSVLDIVNDAQTYPYVVILGDPGSGKSTLLQYLALNWARTPLNNVIELPIPLLIELRSYKRDRISGQCKDFLEFFHKGNIICHLNQHQLQKKLKAGKVLVMFDGLDEVFDPLQRDEVITDIHRFTNDYPNVRVIVTSRIIGYKPQRLRDAEFRHFILQDLEPEQIQDFLNRWHELTFTDEADKVRKRERLQQAVKTSKAIGELAGNPLLLTMMAILNRNQELPRDRPELYNQASRLLLHQWDVEQKLLEDPRIDSVTIDYKDKQAILRQVAYHMQAADKGLAGNLISADDLEKILINYLKTIEVSESRKVARLLIEQLRTRNFILCFLGADSYGFVHRTFLEYFCACEFVERFGKRGLEGGLTLEELKNEVFGKHWQDESWHEVLRLIVGMIDTSFAGEIIDYLIELHEEYEDYLDLGSYLTQILLHRLSLAANCLLEVKNRSAIVSIDSRLLQKLKDLIEELVKQYAYITMHKEHKESNEVDESLNQAVSVVATTWKKNPETLVWLKKIAQSGYYSRSHDEPYIAVEATAVRELAQGWKDAPEILPMLKALAQSENEDDRAAQVAAIQELAQGWKDAPEILPMLKALAQSENENDRAAQVAAIQELAQGWKDDLETLPILKNFIQSSTDGWAKAKVVRELVKGWKDNPDTLPILKTLAQSSKDWDVQNIAVEELARGWKDDFDTLSLLKTCVQHDSSDFIREKVMQELIQSWQHSSDIYDFLYECAVDDSFNGICYGFSSDDVEDKENRSARQTALMAIIEQYPNYPQTLPLIRDRAENDPDEKVREFASNKLAELEKEN